MQTLQGMENSVNPKGLTPGAALGAAGGQECEVLGAGGAEKSPLSVPRAACLADHEFTPKISILQQRGTSRPDLEQPGHT